MYAFYLIINWGVQLEPGAEQVHGTENVYHENGSVETYTNGFSHPKHENRIYDVPRFRASPRHGGAMRFNKFDFAREFNFFEPF
jgi:hypothetical protein